MTCDFSEFTPWWRAINIWVIRARAWPVGWSRNSSWRRAVKVWVGGADYTWVKNSSYRPRSVSQSIRSPLHTDGPVLFLNDSSGIAAVSIDAGRIWSAAAAQSSFRVVSQRLCSTHMSVGCRPTWKWRLMHVPSLMFCSVQWLADMFSNVCQPKNTDHYAEWHSRCLFGIIRYYCHYYCNCY